MAPRRSWAKADNPYWSAHVAAWYRSALDAEDYCRRRDLSTATLMLWGTSSAERGGSAQASEDLQKLRRKERERQSTNAHPNRPKRPRRNRYSVRADSGPIALCAFWSMHVEAMNWSGMGTPSMPQRWVFRPMRCAYGAIAWKNPATKWTGDPCFIRVPGLN